MMRYCKPDVCSSTVAKPRCTTSVKSRYLWKAALSSIEADILGDLYDLTEGFEGRTDPCDITVFKNGGGAHLDLMTAHAILDIA